jgi:hypothetical protein
MEELVRVARSLREEHAFGGYIHLKTIPDAAPELVEEARSGTSGDMQSRTKGCGGGGAIDGNGKTVVHATSRTAGHA